MPETRKKTKPVEMTVTVAASDTPEVVAPKPKMGRPCEYDEEIAKEICFRIAHGEPLVRICQDEHLPNVVTIYRWLQKMPDFCNMYARAREDQADTLADEIQAIADQMPMETTDKDGNTKFDPAYINWMRLRMDARKWVAAKLKPRKYGDRVELAGDKDNPLHINAQIETKTLFTSILENLELKKQAQ